MLIEIKANLTSYETAELNDYIDQIVRKAKYRDSLIAELLAHCLASEKIYDLAKDKITGLTLDEYKPLHPLFEIFDSKDVVKHVMTEVKDEAYEKWFGEGTNVYGHAIAIRSKEEDYPDWYIKMRLDIVITQIFNRL